MRPNTVRGRPPGKTQFRSVFRNGAKPAQAPCTTSAPLIGSSAVFPPRPSGDACGLAEETGLIMRVVEAPGVVRTRVCDTRDHQARIGHARVDDARVGQARVAEAR